MFRSINQSINANGIDQLINQSNNKLIPTMFFRIVFIDFGPRPTYAHNAKCNGIALGVGLSGATAPDSDMVAHHHVFKID